MRREILACVAALAAAPLAGAQNLDLDVSGGLLGENWNFKITGGDPGDFWVLAFADTTGPFPIGFIDGNDPRSFSLDIGMFSYPGGLGVCPAPNPAFQLQNVYFPAYANFHLYAQAFTLPGNPLLIDQLSNNVAIVVGPGHGASVDTIGVPSRSRGFMPGARLPNGDHIIFGGNDGALQGGTYLQSVDRYNRRMLDISTAPAVPDMSTTRAFAAGLALNDGRVLVCGGNDNNNVILNSAEIYDPANNTITPTGSMSQKRYFHSIVKLNDGRVMVFGGSTAVDVSGTTFDAAIAIVNSATDSAEIFNPATGTWSNATKMPWKRTGVGAALLPDGRVLVACGAGPNIISIPTFYRDASIYNPATNAWTNITQVPGNTRALPTVATLADGRIMLSGGCQGNIISLSLNSLADVHIYNPGTSSWQTGAALSIARTGHSATRMPDGKIVICGGASGNVLSPNVTTQVDSWDGATWTNLGVLNHERSFHYSALSEDGQRIFLYGGIESGGVAAIVPTCELFAP